MFLPALSKRHRMLGQIVLKLGVPVLRRLLHAAEALPLRQKVGRRTHAEQTDRTGQLVVAGRSHAPALDVLLFAGNRRAQLLQPIAPVVGNAASKRVFLGSLRTAQRFRALHLRSQPLSLAAQSLR